MSIQKKKLNIGKARRRVQMRSALLLTSAACLLILLLRLIEGMPRGAAYALEMCATLLCFGFGAYLGLFVLDGQHGGIVPLRRLSRSQILWGVILGSACVYPMLLVAELPGALAGVRGAVQADAAPGVSGFTAQVFKSALVVPVCEELFFRGYLFGALRRYGRARAATVVSLCFALAHAGGPAQTAAYALFGALMCLLIIRTDSLLAPVFAHASYNMTLILFSHTGLGAPAAGWSMTACAVKLFGCAAFMAALKRMYTARGAVGDFALWTGGRLTRRETALLAAAAVCVLLSMLLGG